jgi:hypothetical protein
LRIAFCAAVVAHVSDSVVVGIRLIDVCCRATVVAGVTDSILIGIELGICSAPTIVTRVTYSVLIEVSLIVIGCRAAIVTTVSRGVHDLQSPVLILGNVPYSACAGAHIQISTASAQAQVAIRLFIFFSVVSSLCVFEP